MNIENTHVTLEKMISSERFKEALGYVENEIIPGLKQLNADAESSDLLNMLYCEVSHVFLVTGKFAEASKYIEKINDTMFGKKYFRYILVYSRIFSLNGKHGKGIDFLNNYLDTELPEKQYYQILSLLSLHYFWAGDYSLSERLLRECYRYSSANNDIECHSGCLYMFGYLAFQRGHLILAENFFKSSLNGFMELGSSRQIGVTYSMLGILYYRMGRYMLSKEHINISLRYFIESSNAIAILNTIIAYSRLCMFQNHNQRAIKILKKAYDKSTEANYLRGKALAAEFLGESLFKLKEYSEALDYLDEAACIAEKIAPSGDTIGEVKRRISDIMLAQNQLDEAEKYLDEAYDIACKINDKYEMGAILRNYGLLAGKRKNDVLAWSYFQQSFALLRPMKESYEYALTSQAATEYYQNIHKAEDLSDELKERIISEMRKYTEYISSVTDNDNTRYSALELKDKCIHHDIVIGKSKNVAQTINKIEIMAPSSIPILIVGETGVGKELIARLVHNLSLRSKGPFVAVNCASIPETVFESEMFGHRKGAFTGALRDKAGMMEAANGGTLFLDEISELTNQQQAKLLRALQEGMIRRVGETTERPIDVRIVSASNEDVKSLVESGTLRKDFYYRICVETIELEPLRKRKEDILPLFTYYLDGNRDEFKIEEGVFDLLNDYHWPGNVRELVGIVKILKLVSEESGIIRICDLPLKVRDATSSEHLRSGGRQKKRVESPVIKELSSKDDDLLRSLIISSLAKNNGNKSAVARELELSRSTLYRRMKELNINE